jgi:hypothetical protein
MRPSYVGCSHAKTEKLDRFEPTFPYSCRPQSMLATDPSIVVAAARDEATGVVYN